MTKRAVFHRWSAETSKAEAGERGPVTSSLVVKSAPRMCSSLEQRIVLYDDIKRVDLINVLNKEETFDPEAVYFAYPFAVGPGASAPGVRFEIAGADMAPGTEQLPGTTLDWQTAQHWVEFSGQDARVVWSPVEAPLVQFGDINTGKWQTKFASGQRLGLLLCHEQLLDDELQGQPGRAGRVPLQPDERAARRSVGGGPVSDRVSSTRFGWEVHTPLVAAWLPAGNKGPVKSVHGSFLSVDRPNVIVQALWLDEDGTPVVRLREIAGEAAEARLTGALVPAGSASVRLRPFEMQAVRLAK